MLQEYRVARPHPADQCPTCAPSGPGHQLCLAPGCDELAAFQTRRHATQAEYDAIPEAWKPIDAVATLPVFACDEDEHAEATAPFCDHGPPKSPACPTCDAQVGEPCTRKNGAARTVPHQARLQLPLIHDRCTHVHREDCQVFTGCQCTAGDPDPAREPRIVGPSGNEHIDATRSKLPFELLRPIVEAHDIPWWTVREVATGLTQDNKPMITVEYALLDDDGNLRDDGHGHEVLEHRQIPLDLDAPPAPGLGAR